MGDLKSIVYSIFSDTVMISLALLVIPVLLLQTFVTLTQLQSLIVGIIDWLIWAAFLMEFALKLIVEKRRLSWLVGNWLDSIVSLVVIASPLLTAISAFFKGAPLLRLLRLLRLVRIVALAWRTKRTWQKLDLKVYVAFFLVLGTGFVASFFATLFSPSANDITWLSLFVSIFGVFYAVLVSFFIVHVWGKFNTIGSEISRETNSLRNVYVLARQLSSKSAISEVAEGIASYVDGLVDAHWGQKEGTDVVGNRFLKVVGSLHAMEIKTEKDKVVFGNIIEELRSSSVAQANLSNLVSDKTPKILWVLLIFMSVTLVGSFVFLDFQSQFLATAIITLMSAAIGLVVALIFDMDTPLEAGFWNISPQPYFELKEFIKKMH